MIANLTPLIAFGQVAVGVGATVLGAFQTIMGGAAQLGAFLGTIVAGIEADPARGLAALARSVVPSNQRSDDYAMGLLGREPLGDVGVGGDLLAEARAAGEEAGQALYEGALKNLEAGQAAFAFDAAALIEGALTSARAAVSRGSGNLFTPTDNGESGGGGGDGTPAGNNTDPIVVIAPSLNRALEDAGLTGRQSLFRDIPTPAVTFAGGIRSIPTPNLGGVSLAAGRRLDAVRAAEAQLEQARRDSSNSARLAAEEGLQLQTALAMVARDIGITVDVSQDQARVAVEAAQAERELDAARRAATNSARLAAEEGFQAQTAAMRGPIPIPQVGVAPIGAIPIPSIGVAPFGPIPLPNVDVSNDAAREFIAAAEATRSAGEQFRQSVVVAGAQFTASLVQSIRSGDVGGAFQSVLGLGGQLAGAAASGLQGGIGSILGLTASAVPGLNLAAALLPIIGGIFGSLFSPREEAEATRAPGAQARGAPAVEFNLTQNNSIAVNGMPEFRDALTDSVTQLARVIETNLIPRITRLEANA
jgi:hypothetical protein